MEPPCSSSLLLLHAAALPCVSFLHSILGEEEQGSEFPGALNPTVAPRPLIIVVEEGSCT